MQIANIFLKNKTAKGIYNGEEIMIYFDLSIDEGDILRFTFEKAKLEWRQGISLIIRSKKTKVKVNEQITNKSFTLWHDTAPKKVEIEVVSVDPKSPFLAIKNSWKSEDRLINFPNLGGAMKVRKEKDLLRFYCNDGHDDDNFDDLVFTVKKITDRTG